MTHTIVFSPAAEANLVSLYRYIEVEASPAVADRFTGAIVDFCEALSAFPHRGTRRDDIRPGLRILGFRRRVTVALEIEGETVTILGVFYGGQDYETRLQPPD